MKVLTDYLQELSDYENIKRGLAKKETVAINGLVDSQKLHMMYGLSEEYPVRVILTYSDLRAKEIWEEYRFYDKETVYFPGKDFIFFQADIHGNKLTRERICAYRKILEGKPITVVTTFDSIMSPCIPIKVLEQNRIFLPYFLTYTQSNSLNDLKLILQASLEQFQKRLFDIFLLIQHLIHRLTDRQLDAITLAQISQRLRCIITFCQFLVSGFHHQTFTKCPVLTVLGKQRRLIIPQMAESISRTFFTAHGFDQSCDFSGRPRHQRTF